MKNTYNERSWAIDVISEINQIVSKRKKTIRRAGGERTLKASTRSNSLFPDVLLFQDEVNISIIQGWELKMPDTPIEDEELLTNAAKKASLLGLDSFLVWNVSEACLYVLEGEAFVPQARWSNLADIKKREDVESNRHRWIKMLEEIINDLEDLFSRGQIHSQNVLTSFSENKILDVITGNVGLVKQNLDQAIVRDAILQATIQEWWDNTKIEYSSEPDATSAIAKLVLITWVNRFLFTHYLKKFTNKALEIDDFDKDVDAATVKSYFAELTSQNDFLNVYAPFIGEDYIDAVSWEQILQLNLFLSELRLQDIDQALLHQFFEQLLFVSKRKSSGQYATPYALANYLVRVVMIDKSATAMDPFCGTGTILRAIYDAKIDVGLPSNDSINSVWGSDKFSFPLQMSTLSLAKPEVIGEVLNVFQSDVKDLRIGKEYDFIDPNNGHVVKKKLPKLKYIVSNLPFVEAANIKLANPEIFKIQQRVAILLNDATFNIPAKSDLLAYLPYYVWDLLDEDGRAGLIVSNSWLATDWGVEFRKTLQRFFKIDKVITSGIGKWFKNAEIVTNLLVLDKRESPTIPVEDEVCDFITLQITIEELRTVIDRAASHTLLGRGDLIDVQSLRVDTINFLEGFGLGWSSYFTDLKWFDEISKHLVKASDYFEINRGERRGWDAMFLPRGNHGIEGQYLKPVLKNFRSVSYLIADPDGEAFCCSKTERELQSEGSIGALRWINKFRNVRNGVGKPLTDSLARANHHWYEMKETTVADLIATINYGETLFVAKMRQRSFVNQRLIRFTAYSRHLDIDLCHALMNSYIGIFYIEALGFGRGQGALDLSSTKVRDNYFMLNPDSISGSQRDTILKLFSVLREREIEKLPEEVEMEDRISFENAVANAYGLTHIWQDIKNSLLKLFFMRTSVKL